MSTQGIGAVIFVNDLDRVADFYRETLNPEDEDAGEGYAAMRFPGFTLTVHQIPENVRPADGEAARRETARIKLCFPVSDVPLARERARACGGVIDDQPPAWAGKDARDFMGHDPEGNVFQVTENPAR